MALSNARRPRAAMSLARETKNSKKKDDQIVKIIWIGCGRTYMGKKKCHLRHIKNIIRFRNYSAKKSQNKYMCICIRAELQVKYLKIFNYAEIFNFIDATRDEKHCAHSYKADTDGYRISPNRLSIDTNISLYRRQLPRNIDGVKGLGDIINYARLIIARGQGRGEWRSNDRHP